MQIKAVAVGRGCFHSIPIDVLKSLLEVLLDKSKKETTVIAT